MSTPPVDGPSVEVREEETVPSNATVSSVEPAQVTPSVDPTMGAAYSHAWRILKSDFWQLLLVGFVFWLLAYIVPLIIGDSSPFEPPNGARTALSSLYQLLIATPLWFGVMYAWLRAVRGERPEVRDLLVPFQKHWVACIVAQILYSLVILAGLFLFILPGIFLAVRLSFYVFLVVDEGRGPVDALIESIRRTSGHFWILSGSWLLAVVSVIVGFILLVIGSIPATMLAFLALASLYSTMTARKSALDAPG